MSDRHNPRTCPKCQEQAAELRHPAFARMRKAMFVPRQFMTVDKEGPK